MTNDEQAMGQQRDAIEEGDLVRVKDDPDCPILKVNTIFPREGKAVCDYMNPDRQFYQRYPLHTERRLRDLELVDIAALSSETPLTMREEIDLRIANGNAATEAGINWQLLEIILHQQPLLSTFSKEGVAEIRNLERYGYVHLTRYRVLISAKGVNALTIHSIEAKSTPTPEPDALAAALAEIERLRELTKNTDRDLKLAYKEIARLRSAIDYLRWLTTDEREDLDTLKSMRDIIAKSATEALDGTLK